MSGINESGKTGVGLSASELDLVGSEVFIQAVVVEVIHDPAAFLVQGEKVWEGNNKQILKTNNKLVNDFVYSSELLRKVGKLGG